MNIFLAITLDCECDKSWNWHSSNPLTFKNITVGIPKIIQPISDEFQVPPTYLFSNEVLENQDCLEVLKSLKGSYEFGTHLHGDYIEPNKRFNDYAGSLTEDFQGHYSETVELEKLKNLTNLFFNNFGYYPKSFRAGRFGIGKNTFKNLKKLNYNVDTSITPNQILRHPKGDIDLRNYQTNYFLPKIDNNSQNQLLEIPVSIYTSKFRNNLMTLSRSIIYEKIINKISKSYWIRPSYSSKEQMKYSIDMLLKKSTSNKCVIINMMYHSMEITVGASPYVLSEKDLEQFLHKYRKIIEYIKSIGAIGMNLSQIYRYIIEHN